MMACGGRILCLISSLGDCVSSKNNGEMGIFGDYGGCFVGPIGMFCGRWSNWYHMEILRVVVQFWYRLIGSCLQWGMVRYGVRLLPGWEAQQKGDR